MRQLAYLLVVLAACGGGDKDLATPRQCNPLGGVRCVTPWPSALYEAADASTKTGMRVAIPEGALPTNIDGIAIDAAPYNAQDGFSSAAPAVMAFDTGIDGANLVGFKDIAKSLTDASPTVVIDLDSGELVAHFAELDVLAKDKPGSQALYIRPAKMLEGSHHYAIAIKNTLKAKGGGELPVPEGFQAILDGEKTTHEGLETVRGNYDAIFAALEAKGIRKEDLVTAWDFTTRSREQTRQDLVDARDAGLAIMGTNGSALTFTSAEMTQGDARFAKRYDGTFDAPLFLSGTSAAPNTKLLRDADGKPKTNGLYKVPFTAMVPQCAIDSPTPVPLLVYGHGLLGNQTQVASSGPRNAAAAACAILVGTPMRGMSDIDVPNVVMTLNDPNLGNLIFDVLIQGMINHVALVQIARGPMAHDLFKKSDGTSLVDPSRVYYYGISQGGIMGTTVCAIDPVIDRCVLQVGAINYSTLLERSQDWLTYYTTLNGAFPDPLDDVLVINLMQNQWDRTEATAAVDTILNHTFPGTPQKHVFMQMGIADDEVSNVATEMQLRTMDIPVMTPSPYVPYGVRSSAVPATDGEIIFDFGLGGTIPPDNEAPPNNDVHGSIRNKTLTAAMIDHFLDTGEVKQMCTAPTGCDCTMGGCGTDQ